VYLRARYYNPIIGRFPTKDSWNGDASEPLSFNAWNYVNSNPINYTDPTGECPKGWHKNASGTCTYTFPETVLFPLNIPIGGWVITLPDWWCGEQTLTQQPYATPTTTPQSATSTPSSILITPVQTQVNGTVTPTPTPQPTSSNRIQLFRAIDSVEFAVVIATGTYGFSPSGGGKYFAYTYPGVINFARLPFNAGRKMTITNIDIPKNFLANGYTFNDVGGAGLSVHFSDAVLPGLYRVMSPIRILGSL
jgi:hypothetical protein